MQITQIPQTLNSHLIPITTDEVKNTFIRQQFNYNLTFENLKINKSVSIFIKIPECVL